MRILDSIKSKNELITLILFCIGMFLYAIGLSKLGGIDTQTYFYIGGALFILCNYKRFSRADFKVLLIPLLCSIILVILGLLTYFDTIMPPKSFGSLLKSVNQHVIGYFVYFVICYLFARYAREKIAWSFIIFFALMCAMNVGAMIYLAIKYGFYHNSFHYNVPFFFKAIFTYNIWILAPLAFSIAGIIAFPKLKIKIFFALCLVCGILSMLSNGERSFIVAFTAMLFTPFFIWRYKNKAKILLGLIISAPILFYTIYHFSKDLPERYDIAHMIDNFSVVWNTPPIEMGKYDKNCFNGAEWLTCSNESIKNGKSDITWEHSSLSRIAMGKSALMAFLDEPFKPHIPDVFQIGFYLYKYYNTTNPNNRMYMGRDAEINGYNSPHNFVVGVLFCYGIIGFITICVSMIFLFLLFYRSIIRSNDINIRFIGFAFMIFLAGCWTQGLFDVFYTIILKTMFLMFGIGVGLCWRKTISENSSNN